MTKVLVQKEERSEGRVDGNVKLALRPGMAC